MLLACLLAVESTLAAGQAGDPTSLRSVAEVRQSTPRSELALDVGVLAAALSFARGIGARGDLAIGAHLWGAWDPWDTFDRPVWEPIGGGVFARYHLRTSVTGELGLTAARYLWADDCSDCTGRFLGVRGALLAGRGKFAVGPEVSLGEVRDDRYGTDVGLLYGVLLRTRLIPW